MKKIPPYKLFRCHFDGSLFAWLTPLFLLKLSYGGKEYQKHTFWWGWKFYWKRNPYLVEGDSLFLKYKDLIFREYPAFLYVQYKGLPL